MLTELENVQALGAHVNGDRRARELWHFGCEGYIGKLTRELAEKEAELEAELEVTVDGETIPFRMLRPAMANEPDRGRREKLDRAMWEATEEHLNPIYLETIEIVRGALPQLGASNYVELYERFGLELRGLARQCEAFLDSTEKLYEDTLDRAHPRAARAVAGRDAALGPPAHDPLAAVGRGLPGRARWCRR